VEEDPNLAEPVSVFLPGYAADVSGAGERFAGWYRRFVAAMETVADPDPDQQAVEPVDPLDQLDQALTNLTEIPPHGYVGIRRLLAITVLAQIGSETEGDPGLDKLGAALWLEPGESEGLVGLGRDYAGSGDWPAVVTSVYQHQYQSSELAMYVSGPQPHKDCQGSLVETVNGLPVAVFTCDFPIPKGYKLPNGKTLTVADVTRFLNPKYWTANPFWKSMTFKGMKAKTLIYEETVGIPGGWSLKAQLAFTEPTKKAPWGTHYEISPKPPAPTKAVQVDEGDLIVYKVQNGGFKIRTTKHLGFRDWQVIPDLAVGLCFVGYGDALWDLVIDCAGATP
jgi:hypothetical protein